MTLDAPTRALLAALAALGAPKVYEQTPAEARASMAARQAANPPGPEMAAVRDLTVPGRDRDVRVRVFRPSDTPVATLVYLHGGGWVLGDLDGFDSLVRRLAHATGAATVLVDYPLAPEHPYPRALENSWAALQWAIDTLPGLEPSLADAPVVIAGDSAGANLAAVLSMRAARVGVPIAAQVLVYPVVDADFDTGSYLDPQNQLLLDRRAMQWFWDQYVPDVERRADPDVAPLRYSVPEGLAPAVILTAEHDVLRDEGEAYAEHLRRAAVPVHSRRAVGQMHGFLGMPQLPDSDVCLEWIGARLREVVG